MSYYEGYRGCDRCGREISSQFNLCYDCRYEVERPPDTSHHRFCVRCRVVRHDPEHEMCFSCAEKEGLVSAGKYKPFNYNGMTYKAARTESFARSGGSCQCCGVRFAVEAHHWRMRYLPEPQTTSEELTALCLPCHKEATEERKEAAALGWTPRDLVKPTWPLDGDGWMRCCEQDELFESDHASAAFARSGGVCQICGVYMATEAHIWRILPTSELTANDITAVCVACHDRAVHARKRPSEEREGSESESLTALWEKNLLKNGKKREASEYREIVEGSRPPPAIVNCPDCGFWFAPDILPTHAKHCN